MECSINDVVDALRNSEKGCSLLIGAGCSQKAGIPLASGFVSEIKNRYSSAYSRASPKEYQQCMAELPKGHRRELVGKFVDDAKLNWAHLCIAQLVKQGFVDRVLTTNFDPMVVRACALLGVFPAIYDFAASQLFKSAFISDPAVFYLHGQHTGFVQLHTAEEVQNHYDRLTPVFEDAGRGRPWIVVGYSGLNDPVFDHLAEVDEFDYGLYWVGYQGSEPMEHIRKELLLSDKFAKYIRGYDADKFFIDLARKLDSFPPGFVAKPFTHVKERLDEIVPFELEEGSETDALSQARTRIEKAITQFESSDLYEKSIKLLMQGAYSEVITLVENAEENEPEDLRVLEAWAYVLEANDVSENAKDLSGQQTDDLYATAYSKYTRAIEIKPDMHEALYNWGIALSDQARVKTGEEADDLYAAAYDKYARAIEIKPDKHEALNNWGSALSDQARVKTGEEADDLYAAAYDKYARAIEIKPDKHEAVYNWGSALSDQARVKTGEEADDLYAAAYDKYARAIEIKPDKHEALNNWGNALSDQARVKTGEEADDLYAAAYDKYARAIEIKPDKHEALNNWGAALLENAQRKRGENKQELIQRAEEIFVEVEKLQAGFAAYNLACLYAVSGNEKKCEKYLNMSHQSGTLPDCEHMHEDSDLKPIRNKKWFQDFLERVC